MKGKFILLGCLFAIFTACYAGDPSEVQDGPPSQMINPQLIPDPIPKNEPKSLYGNPESYVALGKRYFVSADSKNYHEIGIASWYGTKFHQKRTSSGEAYDMFKMTAAHKSLPLPTYLRVTNLDNGKEIIVRVNDRGPFRDNRLIDLSYAAASRLGIVENGTAAVEVEAINFPKEAPEKPIYIQAGAFEQKQNAVKFASRIKNLFKRPAILSQEENPSQTIYRVRIGPFVNRQLAKLIQSRMIQAGLGNSISIVY